MTHHHVELHAGPVMAYVLPPVPEALERLLTYGERRYVADADHGYRCDDHQVRMSRLLEDGSLAIPAGSVRRITDALHAAGHTVHVHHHHPDDAATPLWAGVWDHLSPAAAALVRALQANRRGTIEAPSMDYVYEACAVMCRAYPSVPIRIMAVRRDDARKYFREVSRRYKGPVAWQRRYNDDVACRVTVRSWGLAPWEYEGITVVPQVCDLLGRAPQREFLHASRYPFYGFLRRGTQLSRREQLQLEYLAGPLIHRIPDHDGLPRPVRLAMVQAPAYHGAPQEAGLERRRQTIWRHRRRNELIARICSAARSRDITELERLGLRLDDQAAAHLPASPRVAVVVETPEHGRELARMLPDARIETAGSQPAQRTAALYDQWVGVRIVTVAHAERRPVKTDVLVNAVGGTILPALRGFPPLGQAAGPASPVVVVDLIDDYDALSVVATQARVAAYETLGWLSPHIADAMAVGDATPGRQPHRHRGHGVRGLHGAERRRRRATKTQQHRRPTNQ